MLLVCVSVTVKNFSIAIVSDKMITLSFQLIMESKLTLYSSLLFNLHQSYK